MIRWILLAVLLQSVEYGEGWSRLTTQIVPVPPQLEIVVSQRAELYRYNDYHMNLTVIKDSKFYSCFIAELDPLWKPTDDDKQEIVENQPCEKISTTGSHEDFLERAGGKIADICKCHYVFWLTSSMMTLQPKLAGGGNGDCKYREDITPKQYDECVASVITETKRTTRTPGNVAGGVDGHKTDASANSGSFPTPKLRIGTQDETTPPPITDEYGFKVPPIMPGYKPNTSYLSSNQPPELAAKDQGNIKEGDNNAEVKPRLLPDGDESAPTVIGHPTYRPPLINGGKDELGFNAPPLSNGDIAPPLKPNTVNEVHHPISNNAINNHVNENIQAPPPYPVPKIGSMDAPPLPAAILRMYQDDLYAHAKKETAAPPTPDMRTPPPPKGLHIPLN